MKAYKVPRIRRPPMSESSQFRNQHENGARPLIHELTNNVNNPNVSIGHSGHEVSTFVIGECGEELRFVTVFCGVIGVISFLCRNSMHCQVFVTRSFRVSNFICDFSRFSNYALPAIDLDKDIDFNGMMHDPNVILTGPEGAMEVFLQDSIPENSVRKGVLVPGSNVNDSFLDVPKPEAPLFLPMLPLQGYLLQVNGNSIEETNATKKTTVKISE